MDKNSWKMKKRRRQPQGDENTQRKKASKAKTTRHSGKAKAAKIIEQEGGN